MDNILELHKNIQCQQLTEEDTKQMVSMYNWASTVPSIQKFSFYHFKQYNRNDKVSNIVYEIYTLISTPKNGWKSIMEKGYTAQEAMKKWSESWQAFWEKESMS